MGRIRILSDNVANKIAAGEVVERPASVVKELLENSLDAGATEIRIDAENAGRRLIRLQDDGCGMLRDDALLAFERHATSKLSDVKDLLAISTLGFRGEALPSIASVSRLVLETRSREEQTGAAVEIAGGKLLRCDEVARPIGTTISVRDLFFNVPARKKFLRSDQTELAHIGSLVTHYSLGHANKRFELYHEGRELLSVTPVESLRDRAFQIFGPELMNDLVDLGPRAFEIRLPSPYAAPNSREAMAPEPEVADFVLEGLVSGPQVQKLNRNSVFLFVNGRLIRDKVVLHAIQAAYHNLMPAGCYPFSLLFLNCDAAEVDVNVHPAKTEVRFRHGSMVHDFVRDAIRETLIESRPASSMPLPSSPAQRPTMQRAADLPFSEFSARVENVAIESEPVEANAAAASELPEMEIHARSQPAVYEERPAVADHAVAGRVVADQSAPALRRVPDTHGALNELSAGWDRVDSLRALPDLRSLGQLHESFIVAAGRDGLWIIDQHVAHERVLFEQVLRQRAAGTVERQQLLMPLVLQLTPDQQLEYARIADELNAHGFETEPFGQRTVAIKAAPAAVGPADIEKIVFEILEIAENELRSASLDEIRRNVCATIACRAAIKINTRLESTKIDWLLRALAGCEYPMTCPHGRPIALRYSTRDILKSFHRI
ncbi:MAG: DNA mismatch repair endonuclease MutL [Bryobacteraceae bacterium]